MAEVIAVKPDHVPIAFPRCSLSNDALMIARLPGTSSAPPTPWIALATIRTVIFGANPHTTEASVKRMMPVA